MVLTRENTVIGHRRALLKTGKTNIPEYDAVVFEYKFDEGVASNTVSMNNIFFDDKNPASFGAEIVTNPTLEGTYVSGVAPDWSVDAGVTASESTGELGQAVQRVSNMNGISQGLQGTSLTLTNGAIHVIELDIKRISGSGNLQLQFDGFNGMTGTYDVASTDIPTATPINIKFYAVANTNSSSVTITADDTSLELDVYNVSAKPVGGGNHLVMDFDVYDQANRGVIDYDFNGVDQFAYIEDSRQSGLDIAAEPTAYAAIIKMDAAGPAHIFGKWKNGDFSYLMSFESPRFIRHYLSSNGTTVHNFRGTTVFSVPMTSFHFVSSTYDTPNGLGRMNVDGAEDAIAAYSAGPPLPVTSHHNNNYRAALGASFDGTNTPVSFVNGKLGHVVFWKGVFLTQDQLTTTFGILRSQYGI